MPSYEVTAPDGRKLRLTGDTPPTDADLDAIFADLPPAPPRETMNFRGLRLARTGSNVEVSPEPTDEEKAALMDQAGTVATGAAMLGTLPLGGGALAGAGRVGMLAKAVPYAAGAAAGGMTYAKTGDPLAAATAAVSGYQGGGLGVAAGRGLLARLGARALAKAATPAAAEVVAEAAPAAYRGIPSLMKIAAPVAEDAAAATQAARATKGAGEATSILKSMGSRAAAPVAEDVASGATKAAGDYMSAAERAAFDADRARRIDAALAARMGGEAAPKVAETVAKAVAPAATGAKAIKPATEVVQFAKQIAKSDPKVGEKIWILLDDAGVPIKRLTSDQAAAAARKGLPTTWVKNLW